MENNLQEETAISANVGTDGGDFVFEVCSERDADVGFGVDHTVAVVPIRVSAC